jgi:Fe-S-cluster containining protein
MNNNAGIVIMKPVKSGNIKVNQPARKEVPCNGCTLCCQHDAIRLYKEDNAPDYLTEPHPFFPGELMLAHKPNGECIYLSENGCTIHHKAPLLCRVADCRILAVKVDYETACKLHKIGSIDIRVWDKGNMLLRERQFSNTKPLKTLTNKQQILNEDK